MVSVKEIEFKILKQFNATLTAQEKALIKFYQLGIHHPIRTEDDRRRINMACIAYIEGFRLGRKVEREKNVGKTF